MKATDDTGPAFELLAAAEPSPLIYAVPHAGRTVPASARARLQATEATVHSLEDPLVDDLVAGAGAWGARRLINRTEIRASGIRGCLRTNAGATPPGRALAWGWCPGWGAMAGCFTGAGLTPRRSRPGSPQSMCPTMPPWPS